MQSLASNYRQMLRTNHVKILEGHARFQDAHTIAVDDVSTGAVLCTGIARPYWASGAQIAANVQLQIFNKAVSVTVKTAASNVWCTSM